MKLILIILAVLVSSGLYAQTLADEAIVDLPAEEVRQVYCDKHEQLLQVFPNLTETEISDLLENKTTELTEFQKEHHSELTKDQNKILSYQIKTLEKMKSTATRKEWLTDLYQDACVNGQKAAGTGVRSLGHFFNFVNLTATFPIRVIYKFFRGLIKGTVQENRGKSLHKILGDDIQKGLGSASANVGITIVAASAGVGTAVALAPLMLSPVIDAFSSKVCENQNTHNQKEIAYCNNVEKTKDIYFKGTRGAEKLGAKIHHFFAKEKSEAPKNDYTDEQVLATLAASNLEDQNICQKVHEEIRPKFGNLSAEAKARRNKELYALALNPGQFAQIEPQEILTPDSQLTQLPNHERQYRNIIISFAPPKEFQAGMDVKEAQRAYKKQLKVVKKLNKQFRKIYWSKSYNDCVRQKERLDFNLDQYTKETLKLASMKIEKSLFEHRLMEKMAKSSGLMGGVKMKWEVITANEVTQLRKILTSKNVANVIVAMHGTPEGKIVDSQMNEIPSSVFQDISASIQTLAFFSCYSQKIVNTYDLIKKFAQISNPYKKRFVFTAKASDLPSGGERIDIRSFLEFLRQVDLMAFRLTKGNHLLQTLQGQTFNPAPAASETCSLKIKGPDLTSGSMGFELNGRFIGSFKKMDSLEEKFFPCSWLESKTAVNWFNTNILEKFPKDLGQIKIEITHPTQTIVFQGTKNRQTSKGQPLGGTAFFSPTL